MHLTFATKLNQRVRAENIFGRIDPSLQANGSGHSSTSRIPDVPKTAGPMINCAKQSGSRRTEFSIASSPAGPLAMTAPSPPDRMLF
jgi:hypothetical protein